MKKFFINNGGQNIGPLDMESIFQKVSTSELKTTDHIYLGDKDEWIPISQHTEYAKYSNTQKLMENTKNTESPVSKIQVSETSVSADQVAAILPLSISGDEWFVLKGKDRHGPYLYSGMIKMLQQKILFEFDYIWHQGMASWMRIAEVADFQPEHIRTIIKSMSVIEASEIFFRRKHTRSPYECPVIIHDNSRVWKGHSIEVSDGGAGIIMENAMVLPGQNVYLHFKPGPHSKSFNVLCEVVSKRYVKGIKDKNTPLVYGIKFINIQKLHKEELKTVHAVA
ncbi:MAG: GYF domain-containing protein [Oligoflexia bacterium]|nr:GYF domain-containing protein [Oligoflexia bacterium]